MRNVIRFFRVIVVSTSGFLDHGDWFVPQSGMDFVYAEQVVSDRNLVCIPPLHTMHPILIFLQHRRFKVTFFVCSIFSHQNPFLH